MQSIGLVVDLTAGNNTITTANPAGWASDVDRITISSNPVFYPRHTYRFTSLNSNLVLDDPGSSTTNGTVLIQYASNGGTNQQWSISQV